jgi:DNA-binding transcriptional ArsR family regulator
MQQLEKIFKALANRRRLAIIFYLRRVTEANVGDIAKEIKLSLRATSRHLVQLERSGILEKRQKCKKVFYQCQKPLMVTIENALIGTEFYKTHSPE